MFAYLVLKGKVCLNPEFANLSSSSMGAIGPGIKSTEDVHEFPVKKMSKGTKIPSNFTHKEGLHGAGAVISRDWLFVDLVNTVSRDNVKSWSNQNPVEGRYDIFHFEDGDNELVLLRYNSHTTAVCALLLFCIPIQQNCLVICMPWRKQATLVLNEDGDDWSPWNDRVNENNGMIVVPKCKKWLSEIVH